jgi:hypothetical protein
VSFQSDADNLSPDDNNALSNIFVRDTVAGTTTLVSRAGGEGGAGADDNSSTYGEAVSDDGRFVVFESGANNLSAEDNDAVSNVFARDVLGPLPAPAPGTTADATAPVGSRLAFKPRSFASRPRGGSIARKRARRGSRVSYRLSEAAAVRFRAERRSKGKRKGRRCVTGKRAKRLEGRRCTRFKKVRGSFTHAGRAGTNRFRFSGRIGGRSLKPGRYRLVARPRDAAGNRGKVFRGSFRIVRR